MRRLSAALLLAAGCSGEAPGSFHDAGTPPGADAASLAWDGSAALDSGGPVPGPDASSSADAALRPDAAPAVSPDAASPGPDAGTQPAADLWVTAYIAGWNLNVAPNAAYGTMPGDDVDYTAFTHGVLFALNVKSDGSLCCVADWDTFAPDRIRSAVGGAHAAGRPILFSVGGAGNGEFATAIAGAAGRTRLVNEIVGVLTTWGFDGVDLDMEPISSSDEPNYTKLVQALAPALAAKATPMLPKPLLTAACGAGNASMYAALSGSFDQINLMTYDLSGAWGGWVSWHNAPIHDGGFRFPSTNGLVPSADGMVDEMIAAGVPAGKIGIGLDFYGYVWKGGAGTPTGGVTAPRQGWTSAPTVDGNVSYAEVMASYYQASRYHWDDQAQAAWLSVDDASDADDTFVSYDDATTAQRKVEYVRGKGIGGLIIWELSGAYLPNAPAGQRDPLLKAVKAAAGL